MNNIQELNFLEQKVIANIDLIGIAKTYCMAEAANSDNLSSLHTLMEIINKNQCELLGIIDNLYT